VGLFELLSLDSPESGVLFVAAPVRNMAFASHRIARSAPCCWGSFQTAILCSWRTNGDRQTGPPSLLWPDGNSYSVFSSDSC